MFGFQSVLAETVLGNGYQVQQTVSPIDGSISGNGYISQQAGQVISGILSGNGFNSQAVFGNAIVVTPTPTPTPSGGGGGGGGSGSGWGYYVVSTGTVVTAPPIVGCDSRIALSGPIDRGLMTNNREDVKMLEKFLNDYEGESLKIDGIYGYTDVLAVKRWQQKYKANILTPMKLKQPTGTVYTSSMRQIERQTTARCGQQIVVHMCPYFRTYAFYGNSNAEVRKIQLFLNIVQGENLKITGKYDVKTRDAVKRFQRFYRKDIVSYVTLSFITGNWNASTRVKANEVIGCDKLK
jgi:peptidoglycan hydrolase-like protein with peptidoglycan-binding domain